MIEFNLEKGIKGIAQTTVNKAINLVNEGKVNLKALVSDVLPLSNWKEG
ncbi:unnamed protein product, partial [marine sediment metagenome]